MSQTILYPFRIDTDFHLGYAWAAELTRRLKGQLLLFTTLETTPADTERLAEVYRALADAQGSYIRNFQILNLRLGPVKSERNFVHGEFTPTFPSLARATIARYTRAPGRPTPQRPGTRPYPHTPQSHCTRPRKYAANR